jgi:hypothetical protein
MTEVIKLTIPEPISHDGKERFLSGWSTAGVGQWLINRKLGRAEEISTVAVLAYGRDSQAHRESVRRNVSSLRRWLATRNEFLLAVRGHAGRTVALKVCDPSNIDDRQMAQEQLIRLEARSEITETERQRWEQMLSLPGTSSETEPSG